MKKIMAIICMLIIIIPTLNIAFDNSIVRSAPPGQQPTKNVVDIDWEIIKSFTENLSKIIYRYNPETELPKGRWFGSDGEHTARDMIYGNFTAWGISVDEDDIDTTGRIYRLLDYVDQNLEVNDISLTIYNTSGPDEEVTEFHIRPRWNTTWRDFVRKSILHPFNFLPLFRNIRGRQDLTHDFQETNLHLYKRPDKILKLTTWIDYLGDRLEDFIDSFEFMDINTFCALIFQNFSEYYGFNWSKIFTNHTNATELPWFNWTIWNSGKNFVFIGENPGFNPNQDEVEPDWYKITDIMEENWINRSKKWSGIKQNISFIVHSFIVRGFKRFIMNIEQALWRAMYLDRCSGLILYENPYNAINETYDMNYLRYNQLPVIYVNRSVGLRLYNDSVVDDTDYLRVNYTLDQKWNPAVDSENVIGEITGTNTDKIAVIGCLYDGFWNQGTADSAIGMSIVMAIANYSRELERLYGIKPKYTLRFIGYGGEEAGLRGVYSYVQKTIKNKENIRFVLDLNQLGYDQKYPRQSLYCAYNRPIYNLVPMHSLLENLTDKTQYTQRTDGYTNLTVIQTDSLNPNQETWKPQSDYVAFDDANKFLQGGPLLKRDTTTICIIKEHDKQPRSRWLQHHRSGQNYDKGDSMELYNESFINATSEICWNLSRYFLFSPNSWFVKDSINYDIGDSDNDNKDDYCNITFNIDTIMPHERVQVYARLYRTISPNLYPPQTKSYTLTRSGKSGYINITDSKNFARGRYYIILHLFNSTGEINNKVLNPNNRPARLFLFANESDVSDLIKINTIFGNGENDDITPNSQESVKAGTTYSYTTYGTDPQNQQVLYQWEIINQQTGTTEYTNWLGPYTSGVNHTYTHIWDETGNVTMRVRVRNNLLDPYAYGNWSNPLNLTIQKGINFTAPERVLENETFNVTGTAYGINASNHTWTYTFTTALGGQKEGQNSSYNYTSNNNYTVNLLVNDSQSNEYQFNKTIQVLHLLSDFTISDTTKQINQTIYFNDTSRRINSISTWNWTFGDGTYNLSQNTTHIYNASGLYNVTLTTTDGQGNESIYTQQIRIDIDNPEIVTIDFIPDYLSVDDIIDQMYPLKIGIGQNITLYADLQDDSPFENAYLEITKPNGTSTNQTMVANTSNPSDFELKYNDTQQIGYYPYKLWVSDTAENIEYTTMNSHFEVCHQFGRSNVHQYNKSVEDTMLGTRYNIIENGTADTITAFIQSNESPPTKAKCMIYNGGTLVGTTDERNISTGNDYEWVTFNFSGTKPSLVKDAEYILFCWSDDKCNITYDNSSTELVGYYRQETYGTPPTPVTWVDGSPPPEHKYRTYSIYCSYSNKPIITDVTDTPGTVGFGHTINISATVTDNSGLQSVCVTIEYPDTTKHENITMYNTENNTYQLLFTDTWQIGQYRYTIWATDIFGVSNNTIEYTFGVSSSATISIATIYDSYTNGSIINLTDPPASGPCMVDYELLDNDTVLHFWNQYDNYYINTTSGIQLTNHKDDYWSHNVLMLGYYQNGKWKKLYRTDELTGFIKDIDDTHTDYLNITFWKNVMANGYPLRLAIRYHLGYEDNELTVIPYIKSRAGAVPYQLAFGWELKDIQINMTNTGDYIDVNQSTYYLNQTLNNTYTDLEEAMFQIQEDINDDTVKSLYMRWNENLPYKLQVKSRTGQYNAPVTLFIKVGTLAVGQEKSTKMYWYDASQITYYFDEYNEEERWRTNPDNMVDGNTGNYAQAGELGEIQFCTDNTYNGIGGEGSSTITKVEIRGYGLDEVSEEGIIYLRPIFGEADGDNHTMGVRTSPAWSPYFDITTDTNAPGEWSWTDIDNLQCDVEAYDGDTLNCSKIEIRVTYNNLPTISNPIPAHNTEGVSITPTLNITVSDPNGDSMTITWLSNSSGNWTTFGTNSSVSNGTYHQTFSNATVNGQWWYWKVQVNDGTGTKTSSIYKFYTGYQSKIKNTGSYDMRGYMLLEVQKYNSTSTKWEDVLNIFNDKGPRTLTTSGENSTIALDTMMNGLLNSSILWYYGNGTYRVHVALRDPDYNVLEISGSTKLEATYEFTLTFD